MLSPHRRKATSYSCLPRDRTKAIKEAAQALDDPSYALYLLKRNSDPPAVVKDVSLQSFEVLVALMVVTRDPNTKQRWVDASRNSGLVTEVLKRVSPHQCSDWDPLKFIVLYIWVCFSRVFFTAIPRPRG